MSKNHANRISFNTFIVWCVIKTDPETSFNERGRGVFSWVFNDQRLACSFFFPSWIFAETKLPVSHAFFLANWKISPLSLSLPSSPMTYREAQWFLHIFSWILAFSSHSLSVSSSLYSPISRILLPFDFPIGSETRTRTIPHPLSLVLHIAILMDSDHVLFFGCVVWIDRRGLTTGISSVVVDPSRVTQISWRPRAFIYRGFLTYEECDHLIRLVSFLYYSRILCNLRPWI